MNPGKCRPASDEEGLWRLIIRSCGPKSQGAGPKDDRNGHNKGKEITKFRPVFVLSFLGAVFRLLTNSCSFVAKERKFEASEVDAMSTGISLSGLASFILLLL